MKPLSEIHDPLIWSVAGLALLLLLAGAAEARRALRPAAHTLLLLASLALLAAVAHPLLVPLRAAVVHRDGTTDDPRVLSALLVGLAALAALVPSFLSLRLPVLGVVGLALPGVVLAGLLGAVALFEGLRQPMGLAGIAMGAFGLGTSLALVLRTARGSRSFAGLLQSFGTSLLVIAAMLSLHGARVRGVAIAEGAAVDTLGMHAALTRVEAPSADLRILVVAIRGAKDTLSLRPELRGPEGGDVQSIADGRLWSGPVVVPVSLRERRDNPHEVKWLGKSESLDAGAASIRFAGFRMEGRQGGDSIRMYADLDVTTAAGTERVSPGLVASAKGEQPFAAPAKGFGPIAVAGIQADAGRVGLMLPQVAGAGVTRIGTMDIRMRPALPVAWLGAALALVAFLFGLVRGPQADAKG